ncbi:hypothetical protein SAMN05421786_104241 [Chryseobacterium ureilyticum]|uniref:Hypervirulence associated protein TUDOR domain-containing protein n=1 Tax=Chryseobacterium ureilyticum TaxID=373668 RepID=A0A1N7P086_9FLAO|nr:hypothetical protein [Chryseobacterium ureilyticum]SIT03993.1 hypothetical protein SAMN05421786_104241 [Chryseobacterium ureilyticum]
MQNHKFKMGDAVYVTSNQKIQYTVNGVTPSGQISVESKRFTSKYGSRYSLRSFPPEMLTLVKKKN